MKYLIIFALCLVVAQAYNVHPLVSKLSPRPAGGRVVGGQTAVNGQFPHMAYLSVACGAILIHEKWLLTAAHCVDGERSTHVYMGDVDLYQSPVIFIVNKFHIHPEFDDYFLNNDVALLEMDRPVTISANVKPIRIARPRNDQFVGEVATLSGFGLLNDDFHSTDVLQHVNLSVISNAQCLEYFHDLIVLDSTLCVNGIENPSQGSCYGDSGSGLILRGSGGDELIGVTSFIGWDGCEGHNPSGFARVSSFLDWIKETTGLDDL